MKTIKRKSTTGKPVVPGLVKELFAAGGLDMNSQTLQVLIALVNLTAITGNAAVTVAKIAGESGVSEDEVAWICNRFISAEFAIVQAWRRSGRASEHDRFYISTDPEQIGREGRVALARAAELRMRGNFLIVAARAKEQAQSVPRIISGSSVKEALGGLVNERGEIEAGSEAARDFEATCRRHAAEIERSSEE